MREKQIHAAVIDHWKWFGLPDTLVATIPNEKSFGQPGLTPGILDLLCIGPLGVGLLELKTDKGKLSDAQSDFVDLCVKRDVLHAVTYGRSEPIRVLEEWQIVRRTNY
jgi:hypothetical protein